MRAPALIFLAGLAVSAAACATVEPATTSPSPVAEGPAPLAGHDWFYHQDEGEARLAYGVAESDDLRLGFDCAKGGGRLRLSALGGANSKPEIQVESGGEIQRFPALAEPSQLHDGDLLTAEAAADSPVFQRFRRIGWIALWQDGEREAYAPHPQSRANIERFFVFCG